MIAITAIEERHQRPGIEHDTSSQRPKVFR